MNRTDIHLLDLPVEILLKILKRLNNMDVLYSLIGVEGLDLLAQDDIFTNTLNFVLTDNGDYYSINEPILNRFCNDILPRIQYNVRSLYLETTTMDHILRAGVYPNLTKLKIFKFHENFLLHFGTDELLFRYNFKKQITNLTLVSDYGGKVGTLDQTTNVFIKLLDFFENLNYLSCIGSSVTGNPVLSFVDLPLNTFVSSNLTKLCVTVDSFGDCLRLLDGRLNQLSTFIVIIINAKDYSSMEFNSNVLHHLKCFSLTYESLTNEYDNQVAPLLHRMCNLQDLTLYIQIDKRNRLVDGIQLENDILIHLSKLETFTFYICTCTSANHPVTLSNDDIQRTFSNVKFGQVGCSMNYVNESDITYHVFSLPFKFDRIRFIGNSFTNTIFKDVTFLCVFDWIPFEHEFFVRLARCFPLLKTLIIVNCKAQSTDSAKSKHDNNGPFEVVQYLHLTSLEFGRTHIDYVEQMLNESKTRLPCLTQLWIDYHQLKTVTNNFTRDATRLNCINIEELDFHSGSDHDDSDDHLIIAQSKDFHVYFPLLKL
ncbi:unnamed protein product [Rotaria magnacalcarata]|uniref:F-box domain-containing protein n=5 Tax=Rotaria magnacalcarata TaxID=392030 RepID=A0A816EG64_9BILA|nr:unnamed protein product [Rotaria magnacalcarata]CAF1649829.1 unnamed protein product [Rotaria magnacalcarata]CAF4145140.1 unnamed protein product [Rotaria magnacalcarata]